METHLEISIQTTEVEKDELNPLSLSWSDAKLLGHKAIDEKHEEFFTVTSALLACDASNAVQAIERFEKHAIEHFSLENSLMESTNFPPRECHISEHEAVLSSTADVKVLLSCGAKGVDLAHDFALYLFEWFPGHADHLDSALVAWISKQQYGGKPVVLRRKLD